MSQKKTLIGGPEVMGVNGHFEPYIITVSE